MRYDGKWSWDELNHELTVLIDLSASVSHELVILNDLSQTSFVPEGNNIAQGTNFLRHIPEKITLGVFVIQSRFIQVLIGTVFSLFPR